MNINSRKSLKFTGLVVRTDVKGTFDNSFLYISSPSETTKKR